MAPEVAGEVLAGLRPASRVIDPMCGSGTVIRRAVEAGHSCVGRDLDPLAVLMSRAWTLPIEPFRLLHDAETVADRAQSQTPLDGRWQWPDEETEAFANYWFAPVQREALGRLATTVRACRLRSRDLLMVCLSRTIITKEKGASLGRDVSHSRPHRVADQNDFDVYAAFRRAARFVAGRLQPDLIRGVAEVSVGDARDLDVKTDGLFDAALTSPPYLNAIDYMRGHRLSLIWLGHSLKELRGIRADNVGAERRLVEGGMDVTPFIREGFLPERYRGWVQRYAFDVLEILSGLRSVVRPGGAIVIVVGNSVIRGATVDNAGIIAQAAHKADLQIQDVFERAIPARRRYLPPPGGKSALAKRMRSECVITLAVPG